MNATRSIDISGLEQSELRRLLARIQRRLARLETPVSRESLRSSDPRVKELADLIRTLSQEAGVRRRDVFVAVAGAMRISIGRTKDDGEGGASET